MNKKIMEICSSILYDYQGLEEHEACECVKKMPKFYSSMCAAILFTHGECSSDRARKLRDYLYLKDINDTPFGV